ncbi:MAG: hypothetical protein IKM61_02730 [Eubacteriaceae bacterium]|nr:hypothetical protein [Eubacteriaceae bacterium]
MTNYIKDNIIDCPDSVYFDEEYFSENVVLALYISEPSCDITHEIRSLNVRRDSLTVKIRRIIPRKVSSVKGGKVYFISMERKIIPKIDNYNIEYT